jgi:hypothetical protein
MDLGFDQPVAMNQGEEDSDDEFGDSQNTLKESILSNLS